MDDKTLDEFVSRYATYAGLSAEDITPAERLRLKHTLSFQLFALSTAIRNLLSTVFGPFALNPKSPNGDDLNAD